MPNMLQRLIIPLLFLCSHIAAAPLERGATGPQIVLNPHAGGPETIVTALKHAKVIPDVLPAFTPKVAINLTYLPEKIDVDLGNTISVPATKWPPLFGITPLVTSGEDFIPTPTRPIGKTLVLALTDPDATSRADPVKGQMCHWIVSGIRFRELNATERLEVSDPAAYRLDLSQGDLQSSQGIEHEPLGDLVKYMQPAPPPRTGKHRYIFVLLEAEKDRRDKPLEKPSDRPHWGYNHVGQGVMDWAKDNGLVPIGANFFYAQNEEQ